MPITPAISICHLTKRYQHTVAVDNLTLDVAPGSIFGFLGPNGAGKTTTIRMLLGLVTPTAGTATILGYDMQRERSRIAPRIGAIVEVPAFYSYLTGAQNLDVLARCSNVVLSNTQIAELIERVGLQGRAHERVQGYSLGMKQRLGIAATLASKPQILFLDEPTNGLDPLGTIAMRQLILRLGAEGYTIFLSSHMLNEVEQMCSDVAIVQRGVVHVQGRVRDLLATEDRYRLEVAPALRALAVLSAYPQLRALAGDDGWITITSSHQEIPSLVRALGQAEVAIFQVVRQQMTLEDLFLTSVQAAGFAIPQSDQEQAHAAHSL